MTKIHEDDDGPPQDDARLREFFCEEAGDLGFVAQLPAPRAPGARAPQTDDKLAFRGIAGVHGERSKVGKHNKTRELLAKLSPDTVDTLYRAYGPQGASPSLGLVHDAATRSRLGRWRLVLEKTKAAREGYEKANAEALRKLIEEQQKAEPARRAKLEEAKAVLVGVQRETAEDDADKSYDVPWHSARHQSQREAAYEVAMLGGTPVTERDEAFTFATWLKSKADKAVLRSARKEAARMVLAAHEAWRDVRGRREPRPRHVRLEREVGT